MRINGIFPQNSCDIPKKEHKLGNMTAPTVPTVPRRLDLTHDLRSRSVFLFGPRQTGKTTYLSALFPRAPVFNLLRGEVFLRLSREPGRLRQELATVARSSAPVIIDEIQKLPGLLDEVHDLIESRGLRFVLAASSPAKLRRGGVNLLNFICSTSGSPTSWPG